MQPVTATLEVIPRRAPRAAWRGLLPVGARGHFGDRDRDGGSCRRQTPPGLAADTSRKDAPCFREPGRCGSDRAPPAPRLVSPGSPGQPNSQYGDQAAPQLRSKPEIFFRRENHLRPRVQTRRNCSRNRNTSAKNSNGSFASEFLIGQVGS